MKLNKRIRQLRTEHNLTSKKLGEILNVSESTISLYESGKRTPNKDLILKMSNYFNVSTDYLLGKSNLPNAEFLLSIRQNKAFDISKELKKMLIEIEKNQNVEINKKIINYEIRDYLTKCLQVMIDSLYLIANNTHGGTDDNN